MSGPPTTFKALIGVFIELINTAIPVLISVTVLYFAWKLVDSWVLNGADEKKRQEGRYTALIGIIVLAVMVSVWAIVNFLRNSIF